MKGKLVTGVAIGLLMLGMTTMTNAALIAHWGFDETVGTTAYDSVGGINGLLTGASSFDPVGGILGGAVQVDTTAGNRVDMGNNFMFGSVDFSVQAWIKTTSKAGMMLVYKHQGGWSNGYFLAVNNVGDGVSAADRAHFYVSNGKTEASSTIVNDGSWHQLVGVYDVSNNQTRLYVDGKLEGTGPFESMVSNAEPFLIASVGYVDEVRIWDHALILSEVDELYKQTINPVPIPGAVWLFGSGLAGLVGTRLRRWKQ